MPKYQKKKTREGQYIQIALSEDEMKKIIKLAEDDDRTVPNYVKRLISIDLKSKK